MSTIRDVAERAGVSVATVSRVLNNDNAVIEATRTKVSKAIEDLSYHPNLLGRNLRRLETKKILILIPTISNKFYSGIIKGIDDKARSEGYKLFICITRSDTEEEKTYLDLLKSRLADGVVFFDPKLSASEINELNKKFPVVQCCEYIKSSKTSVVSIDDEKAGFDATEFLINSGHKRIAFFGTKLPVTSAALREHGFRLALAKNGINTDETLFFYDTYSYNSGMRNTDKLLAREDRPTAIFTIADSIAIGAVRRLTELGYKIPRDIAVFGFDNSRLSELYMPSVSTLSQPQFELGTTAMELLLEKIKNISCKNRVVKLPYEIIKRQTT